MPRRQRRSKEEIQRILKELEESGQSVRLFAKARGLAASTVDLWRRKDRAARKTAKPQLCRVSVVDRARAREPFEIVLPDGVMLRVPACATPKTAEAMVKTFLSVCSR